MKNRIILIAVYVFILAIVALYPSIIKADVHVYDNNNQYLGILMEMEDESGLSLFIPSLGGILKYSYDRYEECGDELEVVFSSSNCTGTPYSPDPNPIIFDLGACQINGFHKRDYSGRQTFTPGSYYAYGDCQTNAGLYPSAEYYPYVQVQIPFTTPIARPLRFEVETKSELVPFPIVVAPKNP